MKKLIKVLLVGLLITSIFMCVGCYESPEKVNEQVQEAVKILEDSELFD